LRSKSVIGNVLMAISTVFSWRPVLLISVLPRPWCALSIFLRCCSFISAEADHRTPFSRSLLICLILLSTAALMWNIGYCMHTESPLGSAVEISPAFTVLNPRVIEGITYGEALIQAPFLCTRERSKRAGRACWCRHLCRLIRAW